MKKMLGCFALVALLCAIKPAQSAPLGYSGSLELRSPVWASESSFEPNIRYLDLAGNIRIAQEGSPLALCISGEHSFSRGYFIHENELRIGAEFRLRMGQDFSPVLFSFWERKYDRDVDRVFVGIRAGFKGILK